MRYITDFIILAQYKVHTPGSMSDYLAGPPPVLRFRAAKDAKAAKSVASEASKTPNVGRHLQQTSKGKPRIPTRNQGWLTHRRRSLQHSENTPVTDEICRLLPYLLY